MSIGPGFVIGMVFLKGASAATVGKALPIRRGAEATGAPASVSSPGVTVQTTDWPRAKAPESVGSVAPSTGVSSTVQA